MTSIKTMILSCRPATSLALTQEEDAGPLMEKVRGYLSKACMIVKEKPFAIRAKAEDGLIVKARVSRDEDGVYFELRRYQGDGVLFVRVWRGLRECLTAQPAHP